MPSSAKNILIIGAPKVGKSTFIYNFPQNQAERSFEFFEFQGTEPIIESYYRISNGFLLMYDLTNQASYNTVVLLYKKLQKRFPTIPVVVCGNKSDSPVSVIRDTFFLHEYMISGRYKFNLTVPVETLFKEKNDFPIQLDLPASAIIDMLKLKYPKRKIFTAICDVESKNYIYEDENHIECSIVGSSLMVFAVERETSMKLLVEFLKMNKDTIVVVRDFY
jgi:hypothetical protein